MCHTSIQTGTKLYLDTGGAADAGLYPCQCDVTADPNQVGVFRSFLLSSTGNSSCGVKVTRFNPLSVPPLPNDLDCTETPTEVGTFDLNTPTGLLEIYTMVAAGTPANSDFCFRMEVTGKGI